MINTFIISELGINHNGDINIAKQLIDASKDCGADAVKFQKRDIEIVYSKEQLKKYRQSPFGTTERDKKKDLNLVKKNMMKLMTIAKKILFGFHLHGISIA